MGDAGPGRGAVEIERVEPLSENHYRLDKVVFRYTRRDGTQQTLAREVYHNGPGAAVLLLDPSGERVALIRQFRIPAYVNGDMARLVEVCAGAVDEGDDPTETARKEVEQETGYPIRDLRKVFELYMSPGASAEKLHLFVATYDPDGPKGEGGGQHSEGEDIEILEMPVARAWAMVEAGEIVDAKTVLLLQHVWLERSTHR